MHSGNLRLALVAAAVVASACSSDDSGGSQDTALHVEINSPTEGEVFTAVAGKADIVLTATVHGLGDGESVATLLDGDIKGQLGVDRTYSFIAVGPGEHILSVVARRADGSLYDGAGASDQVTIQVVVPCGSDADCDDDDHCTDDACIASSCSNEPNDEPGCPGVDDTPSAQCKSDSDCASLAKGLGPCVRAVCDLDGPRCLLQEATDGDVCDDENPCTMGEACVDLQCVGGSATVCDDGNPCTVDTCEAATGCATDLDASACDDGNPCTLDTCSLDKGCEHHPVGGPCDDGNGCTTGESCVDGLCKGGTEKVCGDDGDPCNGTEVCLPETGLCGSVDAPTCGDGNLDLACNEECDDNNNDWGDGCSPDCIEETDECKVDADCDDGIGCTADSCHLIDGCSHDEDDGLCTSPGGCQDAVCDAATGCMIVPIAEGGACDDGNPCTTGETCQGGICTGGVTESCNDGNPCTEDQCVPATGCLSKPVTGGACDDGNTCTLIDTCDNGQCKGGGIAPGCLSPGAICQLVGTKGTTVSCPISIASTAEVYERAAAIQFNVLYPDAEAQFLNFYDNVCLAGIGCFDMTLTGPGSSTMSSGHTVSMLPSTPAQWKGKGAVVIVNFSDPKSHLSNAYVDGGGTMVGDPQFMEARFTLLVDVPVASPAVVTLADIVAAEPSSDELATSIENQIIMTWEGP